MKRLKEKLERHWHHAFIGGHAGYFSLVALEAHGTYAVAAGLLAVMVVVGAIMHLGE